MGEETVLCAKCGTRPGTMKWATDATAFARGWSTMRCERCCLVEQIAHARERAGELAKMEARLAEIDAGDAPRKDGER